ncbi:hypothetical protein OIU76_008698 [Salix suchowensis]|nr:hypothetical protein OIU76_008698 [Salix suchowensis]KAJ6361261.1 hypothetical protein OIU78_001827 [Salix suchowensis]
MYNRAKFSRWGVKESTMVELVKCPRQPVAGVGGVKFGEMERECLMVRLRTCTSASSLPVISEMHIWQKCLKERPDGKGLVKACSPT